MARTKSTTKKTTKDETTQKKKAAQEPKKAAAAKTAKKTTVVNPTTAAKKTGAANAPKAKKPAKPATASKKAATAKAITAAKAPRAGKKAGTAYPVEKRKHVRLHYSRLISFIHYDAKNNIETPGSMAAVRDLSPAGILIETGAAFQRGDRLAMDIAFEQDRIVAAEGDVIHVRKIDGVLCRAGVKFTKIKKKDLSYLKGFVDGRVAKS